MNKILALPFTMLLLIQCQFSPDDCAGCGPCNYVPFSDDVIVKSFAYDTLMECDWCFPDVTFKSIRRDHEYNISGWDLSNNFTVNFDTSHIHDQSVVFKIEGERIVTGTCTPESITNITCPNSTEKTIP